MRWWDRIGSAKEMRAALERACREMAATHPSLTVVQSVPPDAAEELSTLPLQQLHKSALPGNIEPLPLFTKKLASLRQSHRLWLIAGLVLVFFVGMTVMARLAFPHWFAPAVSPKPVPQGNQLSENLKSSQVVTPADLKLGPTLAGHTGIVWSVAFSPKGTLAASASQDKTVILWDTKTWKPKFTLNGHTSEVYSVAFSRDGNILASGSSDATIKLWDVQNGQLIETLLREDTNTVLRVAFSPVNDFLASCSGKIPGKGCEEVRLWDGHNGWKSKVLEGRVATVFAIAFSPDGNYLASAGLDQKLRFWNLRSDGQNKELSVDQPLTTLAFSADGKYLACGSGGTTIKLWSYQPQRQSWEELKSLGKTFQEYNDYITSIAFSPDNKTLVSASRDNTIRLWDVAAESSKLLPVSQNNIRTRQWSVAFSPNGQTLMTGGEDKMVRVWQ